MRFSRKTVLVLGAAVVAVGTYVVGCAPTTGAGIAGGVADAPSRVYVAPGAYDDYYAFLSGGFSGQLAVYGIPSGRLLRVIPVFSQNPENGYGYNAETKAMLPPACGGLIRFCQPSPAKLGKARIGDPLVALL